MSQKNFIKENFVLIVGLALPVLLIALFFVASVLPKSMAVPPQHEMLFTTTRYDYQNPPSHNIDFFVKDGALTARVSKGTAQPPQNYIKRLMVYDGKTQSVREIPYNISEVGEVPDGSEIIFSAFNNLKVDGSSKAPDGYEFDNSNSYGGGFLMHGLFGGGYRQGFRVTKGAVSFKIPENANSDYGFDIRFIGWIIK